MISHRIKSLLVNSLKKYNSKEISIFGSYARGENSADSDLDILVSFQEKISLLKLVQIEQELSDELQMKIDLVTEGSLKNPRLKESVFQDLTAVFLCRKMT